MKTPPATSIADRIAVLGDPTRLRMLRLLEAQELSVGEVAKVLQMAQSSASRHLKALAEAGWVSRRSEGPATFYRLVLDDLDATARGLWLVVRERAATPAELAEDQGRLAAVIAERRTDSAAFFGRVAGGGDSVRGQLFGERFTPAALMGFMPRGWVVADLGCGTGNVAELLAPAIPLWEPVGVAQVAGVALYVLLPELALCLAAYALVRVPHPRPVTIGGIIGIPFMYLGMLATAYQFLA